jgi:drug/metabolite transporter (DMT)-like permease
MWLSYALFSALFLGVRRIYEKRLSADFGNFSLSFVTLAFSLPFTLALFFLFPIPHDITALPWRFWWPLLIIWLVLYPVQNYFLYRSLREGELSEVVPISALLPVFNIATSFFIIGERPTLYGLAGILVTVIATYLLLTDVAGSRGYNYNRPVLFMVITVLCTAIGSTLDKVAVEVSTPVFYSFVNILGASLVFLVLSFFYGEHKDLKRIGKYPLTFVVLGIVLTLGFTAAMFAFSLGPTSYVLALRSGGFLLAAFWGIAMLGESLSRRKVLSIALFVLGTIALAIG